MKALVLNPSSAFTKNVVRDVIYGCWCKGKRIGGGTVIPYWLVLIATILKESGVETDYIDMKFGSRFDPREYGAVIINTSSMSFNEDVAVLGLLKKENPSIKTIVFGSHPTFMPNYCLERDEIDFVVRGEADYVLRDIVSALSEGRSTDEISGIGFKKNGRKIVNSPREYIGDLDDMPFLDDSFIPDIVYFNPLISRYPYIPLITSRGCPGKCVFCPASSFYGNVWRAQSAERVVAEMEHFYKKSYAEVYFRDETFTFNSKRVRDICRLLIRKNIKMKWICNARIGTLDLKLLKLMKVAGCRWIKIGVESGVQEILDRSKKGISVEKTRQSFKWMRQAGIESHAHFMLGMPGETRATVHRTIEFAKEIRPTTASFGICTPYPGTPLFDQVVARHPGYEDGSSVNFSTLHTQGYFNEEFTELKKEALTRALYTAYRKFYLRPSYIFSWLWRIRSAGDLRRLSISAANVLDFAIRGD